MPRFRRAALLAVLVAALGVALRPMPLGIYLEESIGLHWLFTVRGPAEPPSGVAVVSIDRASADQLGLKKEDWPLPRHVHAGVVRSLTRHGVSAIVMDLHFRVRRSPAEDDDLSAAIAESGRVALFEGVDRLRFTGGEIVQTRLPIEQLRDAALATAAFPLPEGAEVTYFWTFFDATAGKVPTLPAVALQIHALPHLDGFLSLLRQAGFRSLGGLPDRVATVGEVRQLMSVLRRELAGDPGAVRRALELSGGGDLPARERSLHEALIRLYAGGDVRYLNFYGPPGRIRTIPFHELLTETGTARLDLKDTVVFVGEGASELLVNADQLDTHRTVYSDEGVDISGAEIAATAFANLLTNRTLRRVPVGAEVGILAGFALLAAVLARLLPGLYSAGAIVALCAGFYAAAQYLFTVHSTLIPLGIPLLAQAPVALFAGLLFRYRDVRKQVRREVEPGAPHQLVQGVCLSTDIENYVTASSGMAPRDLALLMDEYYATMSALVARRRGQMMGRAGDSAMCVWTTARRKLPWSLRRASSTPAVRARVNACQAAVDLQDAIDHFNERHATPLKTRIGLDAGEVAMGGVGGEYHVIGDVANTASRIEGLSKQLGTTILASETVVRGQTDLCLRPVGRFVLAGRPGEVAIVEILGREDAVSHATAELRRRFAEALAGFETGNLALAERLFRALASDYPDDGPSRYYKGLCSGTPPAGVPASRPAIPRGTA